MNASNRNLGLRARRLTAATAGCLIGLAPLAAAGAQTPTTEAPTTAAPSTQTPSSEAGADRHGRRQQRVSQIAERLGVTVEQLKEAGKAARQAVRDSDASTAEDRAAVRREAFAAALGKTTAEIDQAMVDAVVSRVNAAETAGRISAEKAQEIRDLASQGADALRSAAKDRRQNRMDDRLTRAIEAGRITQAQADEITSRVQAGEPLLKVLRDMGLGRRGQNAQGG